MVPLNLGDESDGRKLALAKKPQIQNDDMKNLIPNPRPRRLTPPLPDNKHLQPQIPSTSQGWRLSLSKLSKRREQQSTFEQTQSPLFECLPTEVRLLIWEHYLCSRMLHIIRTNQHKWKRPQKQIVGILCSEPRNLCPCSHHCWGPLARRPVGNCTTHMNYGSYYHENSEWKFDTRRVNFVPLLQTCRRMWVHILPSIFKHNQLTNSVPDTSRPLISSFKRTLSSLTTQIQSLIFRIHFYHIVWAWFALCSSVFRTLVVRVGINVARFSLRSCLIWRPWPSICILMSQIVWIIGLYRCIRFNNPQSLRSCWSSHGIWIHNGKSQSGLLMHLFSSPLLMCRDAACWELRGTTLSLQLRTHSNRLIE